MKNTLARHIISLHPVPLYAVVLASITSFLLLVIYLMGWQLWLVALLILLAWSPIFFYTTRALYRNYRWLAFFFVLLVAQSVHFTEHIAQMISNSPAGTEWNAGTRHYRHAGLRVGTLPF